MAYATVTSITTSTFATNTTAHAVPMAATHVSGELILVVITDDGGDAITTPSGWTELYSLENGTSLRGAAYAKVSDGTEGGTTVNFVTSGVETLAAQVYRITNWYGTLAGIEAGTAAVSTTGSLANNPSLTASWGSADNLWIATAHSSTGQTISSAPTNYTSLTETSTGATTADAQVISAQRNNATATEDPDGFTFSSTGAAKVYNTLVIRPGSATINYTLTCSAGSYSLTGNAATIKYAHVLTCSAGSYSLTGNAATLKYAHVLSCSVGSYSLTGNAATLNRVSQLTCSTGSYSLTGNATTLTYAHVLTCSVGSYSLTGNAATLTSKFNYVLSLAAGSYSLTGKTSLLTHSYKLLCATGTYSCTGSILETIVIMNGQPLYARFPTNMTNSTIVYESIPVGFDDTMPKIKTNISTPVVSVDIVGVGGVSTLQGVSSIPLRITSEVALAETISFNLTKSVLDSTSSIDDNSINNNSVFNHSLIDNVSRNESKDFFVIKYLMETTTTIDALSQAFITNFSDSILLSDLLNFSLDKYLDDNVTSIYEQFDYTITLPASEYILREDGFILLRENGNFFGIEAVFVTLEISSTLDDIYTMEVNKVLVEDIANSETLTFGVTKPMQVEIASASDTVVISTDSIRSDIINKSDIISFTNEFNAVADNLSISSNIVLNPNKVAVETTNNSEILTYSLSKLLADQISISEIVTFVFGSEENILREDSFYVLREDNSLFAREATSTSMSSHIVNSSDSLINSLAKIASTDSSSIADSIILSINTPIITHQVGYTESIVLDLSNYILREDGSSYILRETSDLFIRE